jgi:hypothetical protein
MGLAVVTGQLFTWGDVSQRIKLNSSVADANVRIWIAGVIKKPGTITRSCAVNRNVDINFYVRDMGSTRSALASFGSTDSFSREFSNLSSRRNCYLCKCTQAVDAASPDVNIKAKTAIVFALSVWVHHSITRVLPCWGVSSVAQ